MKKENSYVLVMTACVRPARNSARTVDQAEIRLKEYLKAVEFYITETSLSKIIFCDNSNYDFDYSKIFKGAKKQGVIFEYLKYQGDEKGVLARGKGYGEGETIKYVLENSKILKQEDVLIKVTGRYIIQNIEKIIGSSNENRIYFNLSGRGLPYVNTLFYMLPVKQYTRYLEDAYYKVDDKHHNPLEKCVYERLQAKKIPFCCFPRYPKAIGISGESGKEWGEKTLKYGIKNLLCCLGIFNKVLLLTIPAKK